MLPVKNSKTSLSLLLGRVGVGFLLLSTLVLSSCKDKNEPAVPQQVDDPQWEVTVENDPNLSMTATVLVTVTDSPGTLAAFMEDECCGIGTYIDGLYILYISPALSSEDQSPISDVQLRFYSPELKRIFEASETFPYRNDANLGTPANPYTPTWN